MLYHVMVYSDEPGDHYAHPYAVHLFVGSKPTHEEAFSEAERLLDGHFPRWREDHTLWPSGGQPPLRFVGVERLPVEPCEAAVLAKFGRGGEWRELLLADLVEVKPLTEGVKEAVLRLRLSAVTVDLDWESPSELHGSLEALRALPVGEPKVYRTHRGYHIRAPLPEPARDIREVLEMRRRADDDPSRCRVDELYSMMGYPELANLLFEEKAWWEEGRLLSYTEQPVDPQTIPAKYSLALSYSPPSLDTPYRGGRIWTEGREVRGEGPFSRRMFEEAVEELEAGPFKEAREAEELRRRLVSCYSSIDSRLEAVRGCEIVKEGDLVTIKVPKSLSHLVGRMIGRNGCNIKTVEAQIGLRLRILQEEVPEEVEMRRRLKQLLGRVV
jgi:hypothetical protein